MLANHLDIETLDHRAAVAEFWNAPNIVKISDLKAVDVFRAVQENKIKALWTIRTNPVVSLPN